jgi:hypothetical protein
MSGQFPDNSVTVFRSIRADCFGNIMQMISRLCVFDSFKKALSGNFRKLQRLFGNISNCICAGCIGMIAFVNESCIDFYKVTFTDDLLP